VILLDWFGIIVSSLLLGPFYVFYIFLLSILQETARLIVALAVNAQIDKVFIGGIFGFVSFQGINLDDSQGIMILLAGPLICFLIYWLAGGIGKGPKGALFNPLLRVRKPLAMISLRLGILSLFLSCWQIIRHL